jgi:hypothetical protein
MQARGAGVTTWLATAAALAALGAPAAAHHSFASFDTTRVVRIDGVVAEFQWTNPHAWLEIDVKNPDGGVDRWGVEFNSPNNLTREGWSRHMLKSGDEVTVLIHPLRDGRHAGLYYEVKLADGEVKTVQMTPFVRPEGFDASAAPSAYDPP